MENQRVELEPSSQATVVEIGWGEENNSLDDWVEANPARSKKTKKKIRLVEDECDSQWYKADLFELDVAEVICERLTRMTITANNGPAHFHALPSSFAMHMHALREAIDKHDKSTYGECHLSGLFYTVGMLCLVKAADGSVYRAEVIEKPAIAYHTSVLFLDLGTVESVLTDKLRPITKKIVDMLPPMAVKLQVPRCMSLVGKQAFLNDYAVGSTIIINKACMKCVDGTYVKIHDATTGADITANYTDTSGTRRRQRCESVNSLAPLAKLFK